MIPYALIVDDFLTRPYAVREWAINAEYKTHLNPSDGTMYENIIHPLPEMLHNDLVNKLEWQLGTRINMKLACLRYMPAGYEPKQVVHDDSKLGNWMCIVYLYMQSLGGTPIFRHVDGSTRFPAAGPDRDRLVADANKKSKWRKTFLAPAEFNRAFICSAHLLHAIEPVNGFGTSPKDGRISLVSFFDCEGDIV